MESKLKVCNLQKIYKNNDLQSKNITQSLNDFIVMNLFLNDSDMENKIYNLIVNRVQKKLNLINLILNTDINLKLNTWESIIKFFNWLSPMTLEYKMASGNWNIKTIKYGNKEKILIQNSISKIDYTDSFVMYIKKIKKTLLNSKINYNYFEFKSKRFNKIKDIIWVFDKKF